MSFTGEYLQATEVIDWQHPEVLSHAKSVAGRESSPVAIARACFEWVRDEIHHSVDFKQNPVTCRASDVLRQRTGYCYAKSHLLSALLRANGIPAGFCYQRLSVNDDGAPFSLHGFNAVFLPGIGWYRIDPRGNRPGIDAQFTPPRESLAFTASLIGEFDFVNVFTDPLPVVVDALHGGKTWEAMLSLLPDVAPRDFAKHGLFLK